MEEIKNNDAPKPGTKAYVEAELAAALAELEALKAEKAVQLATQGSQPAQEDKNQRVELFVPKGYANDEPNHFMSINGVNYVLPKGKKSMVPKFVAEEFYRSQRAQNHLDDVMNALLQNAK